MKETLLLLLALMAALFLMIWVAVVLVQSKKLFTIAPKDIRAAALEHGGASRAPEYWAGRFL